MSSSISLRKPWHFQLPTISRNAQSVTIGLLALFLLLTYTISTYTATSSATHSNALNLKRYAAVPTPVALTMTAGNASGLTYNHDTDTLFAVVNGPELLIELNKDGSEKRLIELKGFDDTEGVVYLGNQRYAIIEEDRRTIALATIGELTRWVYREDAALFSLPLTSYNNKGFEGISYDASSDTLTIVNEKRPRAIYQVSGLITQQRSISVSTPWDLEDNTLGSSDFSGVHYNADSNSLLLLSDESNKISEVTSDGQLLSEYSFNGGWLDFSDKVPQAEGITIDNEGTLYVLSEPNLLYRIPQKS